MQTADDTQTKSSHGLGRGLDSLIPTGFDVDESVEKATGEIDIELIAPNPQQPRREFEEEALVDLANSIRKYGVIQPLLVTKNGDRYELVAGERRLRASKIAGLKKVPVIERTLEEHEKLEIAIIENLQRENLNAIELAYSYKRLIDQYNLTQEEVGQKLGKARSTIANTIRLLTLPHEVKQALIDGKITEGHARTLLSLPNVEQQLAMLKKILEEGYNVRDVEVKATIIKNPEKNLKDANIKAAEKRLSEAMGTKVVIKGSPTNGKVQIDYYSLEDLERIFTKIVGN